MLDPTGKRETEELRKRGKGRRQWGQQNSESYSPGSAIAVGESHTEPQTEVKRTGCLRSTSTDLFTCCMNGCLSSFSPPRGLEVEKLGREIETVGKSPTWSGGG